MRYLHFRRRRRCQPRDHGAPYQYTAKAWSLDDWDETLVVYKTRFTKHQIRVLAVALKTDAMKWSYGIQPEPIMAKIPCEVISYAIIKSLDARPCLFASASARLRAP
jgi:hypothetical protein